VQTAHPFTKFKPPPSTTDDHGTSTQYYITTSEKAKAFPVQVDSELGHTNPIASSSESSSQSQYPVVPPTRTTLQLATPMSESGATSTVVEGYGFSLAGQGLSDRQLPPAAPSSWSGETSDSVSKPKRDNYLSTCSTVPESESGPSSRPLSKTGPPPTYSP
jgi:hypothetical protein